VQTISVHIHLRKFACQSQNQEQQLVPTSRVHLTAIMPAKQKILWSNHKGGVGKTVLVFHTACAIAQLNPNVWRC
jgi:hypothetical protein